MNEQVLLDIKNHAKLEYPKESCGVVVVFKGKHKYVPCRNMSDQPDHFILNPEDWAVAEDLGEPVIIVHSHPDIPPDPSQADLVGCESSGLPWLIVNWPAGTTYQFSPTGYIAPLIGRVYAPHTLDCYTLIQDYYKQELNILLDDAPVHSSDWWKMGQNLYLDNYEKWGFIRVSEPNKHDVLLLQIGGSVSNHGAIFLGDGCILHHQSGRLSSRDVYGGWYRKVTTDILRHRSLVS